MAHAGARELLEQLKNIIGELRGVQQRGINKTCKKACDVLIRALELESDSGVELYQQVAAAGSDATNLPQFEDTLRQVLDIAQDAKQLLPKCRQRPFPTFSMKANKKDLLRLTERLSKILLNPLQASHDIRINDHNPRSVTTLQLNDKFIALGFVNHPHSSSSLWLSFHLNLHVYDTHTMPYQSSWSGTWQRPVTVVAVSRRGEIWTGHQKGLVGVHHHNGITTPAQLLPGRVTAIAFDEDEAGDTCTAWVCDDHGNVRLCSCDERGITVATSIALADAKYQYGGGRETLGGAVNAIVVHRNRALMATGGSSPSLLLWSTRKGMQHSAVDVVKVQGGEVKHIAVIPSKGTTASWHHHFFIVTAHSTASDRPPLTIWCVEDSSITEVAHYKADLPNPPLPPICGVHIFPKVGIMATVHDDSVLAIWPLPTHAYQLTRRASSARATATQTFTPRVCRVKLKDKDRIVASTADASRLAVAWVDGIVRTWDATWLRNRAELDKVDFSKADLATRTSSGGMSSSSGGTRSLGASVGSTSRRGLLSGMLSASMGEGDAGWGRSSDDLGMSASSNLLAAAWRTGAAGSEGGLSPRLVQDLVAGDQEEGGAGGRADSETTESLVESQDEEGGGAGGAAAAAAAASSAAAGVAGRGRRMSLENQSECPKIEPQNLQFVQTIGSGSFGEVQLANYEHTQVAVKRLKVPEGTTPDKKREMLLALDMEVQMLHSLVYVKNCIRLLGWCQDPPMIITDYYPKGSLFHNLKGIREKNADMADSQLKQWLKRLEVAKEIAAGMQQMHAKEPPIIHGDLRSPNIFLTSSYEPRIGDFGLAKRDNSPNSQTRLTNARSVAPELYKTHELTTATDVYAYGIILWELLTFKIPYEETNTVFVMCDKIANKDAPHHPEIPDTKDTLPFPPDSGFHAYRALLSSCFAHNPAERPSFRQIAHQLSNVINKAKMSQAVTNITASEAERRPQPRMRGLVNTVIAVHRSTMAESSQSTLAATQSELSASPPAASFLPAATCPICSRTQALCSCRSLVHADRSPQPAAPPSNDDLLPSSQIIGVPSNEHSLGQGPSNPSNAAHTSADHTGTTVSSVLTPLTTDTAAPWSEADRSSNQTASSSDHAPQYPPQIAFNISPTPSATTQDHHHSVTASGATATSPAPHFGFPPSSPSATQAPSPFFLPSTSAPFSQAPSPFFLPSSAAAPQPPSPFSLPANTTRPLPRIPEQTSSSEPLPEPSQISPRGDNVPAQGSYVDPPSLTTLAADHLANGQPPSPPSEYPPITEFPSFTPPPEVLSLPIPGSHPLGAPPASSTSPRMLQSMSPRRSPTPDLHPMTLASEPAPQATQPPRSGPAARQLPGPFTAPPSTSRPTTPAAGQVPSPFAAPPSTSRPTTPNAGQVPSPFAAPPSTSRPSTSAAGQVPSPFAMSPPTSPPSSAAAEQLATPFASPSIQQQQAPAPHTSAARQARSPFAAPPPQAPPTAPAPSPPASTAAGPIPDLQALAISSPPPSAATPSSPPAPEPPATRTSRQFFSPFAKPSSGATARAHPPAPAAPAAPAASTSTPTDHHPSIAPAAHAPAPALGASSPPHPAAPRSNFPSPFAHPPLAAPPAASSPQQLAAPSPHFSSPFAQPPAATSNPNNPHLHQSPPASPGPTSPSTSATPVTNPALFGPPTGRAASAPQLSTSGSMTLTYPTFTPHPGAFNVRPALAIAGSVPAPSVAPIHPHVNSAPIHNPLQPPQPALPSQQRIFSSMPHLQQPQQYIAVPRMPPPLYTNGNVSASTSFGQHQQSYILFQSNGALVAPGLQAPYPSSGPRFPNGHDAPQPLPDPARPPSSASSGSRSLLPNVPPPATSASRTSSGRGVNPEKSGLL